MTASLASLPLELLFSIFIDSHSDSLALVSKYFQSALRYAPNTVRARYLLACWEAGYARQLGVRHFASKFLPVVTLPGSRDASTLISSILEYCVCFPCCNHIVIEMIERHLLDDARFGNFRAAMNHELTSPCAESASMPKCRLSYIPIHELPKRLFRSSHSKSTRMPLGDPWQNICQGCPIDETRSSVHLLKQHLSSFTSTERPLREAEADERLGMHLSDALLLLRILLMHHPISTDKESQVTEQLDAAPACAQLVNSHEGYPLCKSVAAGSQFLVGMLLAFGAKTDVKNHLPLIIASRRDWTPGLKMMVAPDKAQIRSWYAAICNLREWFEARSSENWQVGPPDWEPSGAGSPADDKSTRGPQRSDWPVFRSELRRQYKVHLSRLSSTSASSRIPSRALSAAIVSQSHGVVSYLLEDLKVPPTLEAIRLLEGGWESKGKTSSSPSAPASASAVAGDSKDGQVGKRRKRPREE